MARKERNISDPKTGEPVTTVIYNRETREDVVIGIGDTCNGVFCVPTEEYDTSRLTFVGIVPTASGWLRDVFTRTTRRGETVYEMRMATGSSLRLPAGDVEKIVTTW